METITISMPKDQKDQIQQKAKELDLTASNFIRRCVKLKMQENKESIDLNLFDQKFNFGN